MKKDKMARRTAWVTMKRHGTSLSWEVRFPATRNGVRCGTQRHSQHDNKEVAVAVARGLVAKARAVGK